MDCLRKDSGAVLVRARGGFWEPDCSGMGWEALRAGLVGTPGPHSGYEELVLVLPGAPLPPGLRAADVQPDCALEPAGVSHGPPGLRLRVPARARLAVCVPGDTGAARQ